MHRTFKITLCREAASKHLRTISRPVGICHVKRARLVTFMAMWAVRAVLLPLAIRGTMAAAPAHRQTMVAPAYRWGPGNNFPVAGKALHVGNPHEPSTR